MQEKSKLEGIADIEYIQTENMHIKMYAPKESDDHMIDYSGIQLPMTIGKYKLFLAHSKIKENQKRGHNISWDAKLIYEHIIFTGMMQGTNQVWANNNYLSNGLNISPERVAQGKRLLVTIGLIEYVRDQRKDKENGGLFGKQYIKILTVTPLSRAPLNPLTALEGTNALSNKVNALSNKRNILVSDTLSKEKEQVREIIDYLNKQCNKKFTYKNKSYNRTILARLSEGYKVPDFFAVIDIKKTDDYFIKNGYLNPDTLFREKNMEKYLNQKQGSALAVEIPDEILKDIL